MKERWSPGEKAWFEYHCFESLQSDDAEAWLHSHQLVTVLELHENDSSSMSLDERLEAAMPFTYSIEFSDGLIWGAFEDELSESKNDWYRPDPPSMGMKAR